MCTLSSHEPNGQLERAILRPCWNVLRLRSFCNLVFCAMAVRFALGSALCAVAAAHGNHLWPPAWWDPKGPPTPARSPFSTRTRGARDPSAPG